MIKVVNHIPPTIAKYEEQKPAVFKLLHEKLVQETMKGLQGELAKAALAPGVMKIENDELRRQFDMKAAEHRAAVRDENTAQREVAQMRRVSSSTGPATSVTTGPATSPTTGPLAPTTGPATLPVVSPAGTTAPATTEAGRPPATMPGAASGAVLSPTVNPGHPTTKPANSKP